MYFTFTIPRAGVLKKKFESRRRRRRSGKDLEGVPFATKNKAERRTKETIIFSRHISSVSSFPSLTHQPPISSEEKENSLPVLAALHSAAAADKAAATAAAVAAASIAATDKVTTASSDQVKTDDPHPVRGPLVNKRTTNKNQGKYYFGDLSCKRS